MASINLNKNGGPAPGPVVSPNYNPPSTKQPPSIYTVMLLLAMLFMLIACIAMYMERARWGPDFHNVNSARPQVMVAGPPPAIFA